MIEDGLGGACVLPDGQSFPPGGGDAAAEFGGGDAVDFECVHGAVRPPAPGVWAFVQRATQVVGGGRPIQMRRRAPSRSDNGLRVSGKMPALRG